MEVFQQLYEKALIKFVDFWIESKPKSIMNYNEISVNAFIYKNRKHIKKDLKGK